MAEFEPLSQVCAKCRQVTGKDTCFPGSCVFFHEHNIFGSKSNNIAQIDRIRRGMRQTVGISEEPSA